MSVLEGFRFRSVSSPMHKLDPRVKFLYICVMFVVTLIYTEMVPLIILFLIQLPPIFLGKSAKQWLKSMRGATFLAAFILISTLVSQYLYSGRILSLDDYEYSLSMAFRFVVLVESFSLFFLTTSPDHLGLALEQSGVPYQFCFAFTTAVRFVPVLADEAQRIIDAQRSRGMELEKGNFLRRVKNFIPILIPLIVNAIRRSLELAEAMESRAWGSVEKRSNLYVLKVKRWDIVLIAISILIASSAIYLKLLVYQGTLVVPQLLAFFLG